MDGQPAGDSLKKRIDELSARLAAERAEKAALEEKVARLTRSADMLEGYCALGASIFEKRSRKDLLPDLIAEVSRIMDAERSTLFLVPWERLRLMGEFAQGLPPDTINLYPEMGLIGVSVLTRRLINVANAQEDPRFNPSVDQVTGYRTESLLCAPLVGTDGMVRGAVELLNKETGVFTGDDEHQALKYADLMARVDIRKDPGRAAPLAEALRKQTRCDRCSVFTVDRDKGELFTVIGEGLESDIRLSLNLGIAGLVAVTGQILNVPDPYADPRFDRSVDEKTGFRTRSLLCVPLKNRNGEVIGVIEAINKRNGPFSRRDEDVLRALSTNLAMFVENTIISDEYQLQFRSVLEVLAASIDAKDPLTANHSQNVTRYAVGLARELGFREEDLDILSVSALLHDYGKIGVEEAVLRKPGRLTASEFDHIKLHVHQTRKILGKMAFIRRYRNVPLIASCHHERLDGSGYLDGMTAGEIPFMSKIIAVADVFEALTAKRHYRDAMSLEDAFRVLDEGAGNQFDENIVGALKRYCRDAGDDGGGSF